MITSISFLIFPERRWAGWGPCLQEPWSTLGSCSKADFASAGLRGAQVLLRQLPRAHALGSESSGLGHPRTASVQSADGSPTFFFNPALGSGQAGCQWGQGSLSSWLGESQKPACRPWEGECRKSQHAPRSCPTPGPHLVGEPFPLGVFTESTPSSVSDPWRGNWPRGGEGCPTTQPRGWACPCPTAHTTYVWFYGATFIVGL